MMEVEVPGPPWVAASTMGKVSRKAYTALMEIRKNTVGESNGSWMVQNLRHGRAPSMAAASISDFGMLASPARKNRKLYEICCQTAAITISAIASVLSSRLFQGMPSACNQYETMPTLGENMNNQSTPAMAGGTA